MKQKLPAKEHDNGDECSTNSCRSCQSCKAVEFEELRQKPAGDSLQLYAREAENYFFYYALSIKKQH
ncbi:MAG TPA: hypothetical protein VNT20_12940 [Flavisolibacter sp.]|jgi:hypothetical protein|nr:hypothetical protein [Flavisolibacter sp.]